MDDATTRKRSFYRISMGFVLVPALLIVGVSLGEPDRAPLERTQRWPYAHCCPGALEEPKEVQAHPGSRQLVRSDQGPVPVIKVSYRSANEQ
jgi:hypothetical protein